MAHEYYYLGRSTGLAQIHGSNAFICIDTASLESVLYARGYPLELNELSVFKRFLSPGDVFLDVGANFGMYTAIAASILEENGSIHAFEANPQVYRFLQKTLLANNLQSPRHKATNIAAGPSNGVVDFLYDPERLGGGRMAFPAEDQSSLIKLSSPMAPLDALVDDGVTVDIVKIDVESHELSVLQGMRRIVERSPHIRLLIENFVSLNKVDPGGIGLISLLREMGLSVCTIGSHGQLVLVPDGESPTHDSYLFATRTPDQDIARSLKSLVIRPHGLHCLGSRQSIGHPMLQDDGSFLYQCDRITSSAGTTIFYGPYISLRAGSYALRFLGAKGSGRAVLRISHNGGEKVLCEHAIEDWGQPIPFSAPRDVKLFEIVLQDVDLKLLRFREIELEIID